MNSRRRYNRRVTDVSTAYFEKVFFTFGFFNRSFSEHFKFNLNFGLQTSVTDFFSSLYYGKSMKVFCFSNPSEDVATLVASQTLKKEKSEPWNLAIFGARAYHRGIRLFPDSSFDPPPRRIRRESVQSVILPRLFNVVYVARYAIRSKQRGGSLSNFRKYRTIRC